MDQKEVLFRLSTWSENVLTEIKDFDEISLSRKQTFLSVLPKLFIKGVVLKHSFRTYQSQWMIVRAVFNSLKLRPQLISFYLERYFPASVTFLRGPYLKTWHAEKIKQEKSFQTNPNMTYFAISKAKIIVFEVWTSKKRFSRFSWFRKS